MLRVSFQGLRKATYLPSGESWAPAISGLPKNSSRSMSGGAPALAAWARAGSAGRARTAARATRPQRPGSRRSSFIFLNLGIKRQTQVCHAALRQGKAPGSSHWRRRAVQAAVAAAGLGLLLYAWLIE